MHLLEVVPHNSHLRLEREFQNQKFIIGFHLIIIYLFII
jgi:hypothetical protein